MMINQVYRGHLIRKRFGQTFLTNKFVIDNIVSAISPQKGQAMVEIGSGFGALTEPISKYLDKLTIIELDRDLTERLKKHQFLRSKLIIYQQDALTMNFDELAKKMNQSLRVFGNPPYNISTALIFHLFNYTSSIIDIHFTLQKEVVKRLVAKPSSKAYGRLSVMAQYICNIKPMFAVPSSAFTPKPKVNSIMVRLVPRKKILYPVNDLRILNRITTEAFNQRRKTIRNSLGELFSAGTLEKLGNNLTMRAENISVEQYCRLANYISDNPLHQKN